MRFKAGDRVRIKQSVTRYMCGDAIIPSDFPGMEVEFKEHRSGGRARINARGCSWFIPLHYLERINTCMFNHDI